jgi:hypothetical protein
MMGRAIDSSQRTSSMRKSAISLTRKPQHVASRNTNSRRRTPGGGLPRRTSEPRTVRTSSRVNTFEASISMGVMACPSSAPGLKK